jgi:hypothetical protein
MPYPRVTIRGSTVIKVAFFIFQFENPIIKKQPKKSTTALVPLIGELKTLNFGKPFLENYREFLLFHLK